MNEVEQNAGLLIVAGSETTATLLAGVTYLLLAHSDKMKKLETEVFSTFNSEDEINIRSVGQLSFLSACLDEALRFYPPVPFGLTRIVPPGGSEIAGRFITGGVSIPVDENPPFLFPKPF